LRGPLVCLMTPCISSVPSLRWDSGSTKVQTDVNETHTILRYTLEYEGSPHIVVDDELSRHKRKNQTELEAFIQSDLKPVGGSNDSRELKFHLELKRTFISDGPRKH